MLDLLTHGFKQMEALRDELQSQKAELESANESAEAAYLKLLSEMKALESQLADLHKIIDTDGSLAGSDHQTLMDFARDGAHALGQINGIASQLAEAQGRMDWTLANLAVIDPRQIDTFQRGGTVRIYDTLAAIDAARTYADARDITADKT